MKQTDNPLLFVYGTLRRAIKHPMHKLLAENAEFIANAWIPGALFEIDSYPGAIYQAGTDSTVHGEVYRLQSSTLQTLDAYEECSSHDPVPHEYQRALRKVVLQDDIIVTAWIYLYNFQVADRDRIECGDYLVYQNMKRAP